MPPESLVNVLEAALLAAGRALTLDDLLALFVGSPEAPDRKQLREGLSQLDESLAGRGIELVEVASGYRLQVRKEYSSWLAGLFSERPPRYSRALLETLALITYRQPITRGEIEEVRGVAVSSNIIKTLMEREWIRVLGHREVPGRPALYGTTREFLDHFGLKSLEGLPPLAEIRDLDQVAPDLFAPAATGADGADPQNGEDAQSSDDSNVEPHGDASADEQEHSEQAAGEGDDVDDPTPDASSPSEMASGGAQGDEAAASIDLGAAGSDTASDDTNEDVSGSDDVGETSDDASRSDEVGEDETLPAMVNVDSDSDAEPDSASRQLESERNDDESPVVEQSGAADENDSRAPDDPERDDEKPTAGAEEAVEHHNDSAASPADGDDPDAQDEPMSGPMDETGRGALDVRR